MVFWHIPRKWVETVCGVISLHQLCGKVCKFGLELASKHECNVIRAHGSQVRVILYIRYNMLRFKCTESPNFFFLKYDENVSFR